jgi:hypothetical protein
MMRFTVFEGKHLVFAPTFLLALRTLSNHQKTIGCFIKFRLTSIIFPVFIVDNRAVLARILAVNEQTRLNVYFFLNRLEETIFLYIAFLNIFFFLLQLRTLLLIDVGKFLGVIFGRQNLILIIVLYIFARKASLIKFIHLVAILIIFIYSLLL